MVQTTYGDEKQLDEENIDGIEKCFLRGKLWYSSFMRWHISYVGVVKPLCLEVKIHIVGAFAL